MFQRMLVLALACCLSASCSEDAQRPSSDGAIGDGSPPPRDQGALVDRGVLTDLPNKPGDPCWGTCAGPMLCIAGQCTPTCTATPCNDKAPECSGGQSCIQASDFADACYAPDANEGDECDDDWICEGGTVCAHVNGRKQCTRLCKYGCPGGSCQTKSGCEVCVK
jgi:hypothetical protein